jgi:nucleotide-binding universal stress UspA family protein
LSTKVLVALLDAESMESLVRLACEVAKGMDAELVALHVVEVPAATPISAEDEVLDQAGKALLAQAKRLAGERFSLNVATRLLRARQTGQAIVAEANDLGVHTLVMGHRRRPAVGELLLGSTARYAWHNAPCRIIIEVPPREAK